MNLFSDVKVHHLDPDVTAVGTKTLAAGTTDVNSESLDRKGFDGAAFLVVFGDNLITGTFSLDVEHSADNVTFDACEDRDGVAITEAMTAGATDSDYEMLGIEVTGSKLKRYVRVVINRGTANTVVAALLGFLVNPDKRPVTQPTAAGNWNETPEIYTVCS